MEWAFTWSFWLTLVAGALGAVLLIPVFKARIPGLAGITFAGLLILESANFITDGLAWLIFFEDRAMSDALGAVTEWTSIVLAPTYLFFLRFAAPNPATRWLRTRAGAATAWIIAIGYVVYSFVFILGFAIYIPFIVVTGLRLLNLAVYVLAIVAAVLTFVRARGPTERQRGAALLLAFGVRDVAWILSGIGVFDQVYLDAFDRIPGYEAAVPTLYIMWGLVGLVYFPSVVYAMLSGRIVDLNEKFKVGLAQTTAAAIVGTFFLVFTESLEAAIDTESPLFSVLVAVVLAFLFRPIQMIAARLTTRFFPGDDDHHAFFREQLVLAYEDGVVTDKERNLLLQFANRLGIPPDEVAAMEADVRAKA